MEDITSSRGSENAFFRQRRRLYKWMGRFIRNQLRWFSARRAIHWNTFRLAPDRFLTVFGVLLAIWSVHYAIYMPDHDSRHEILYACGAFELTHRLISYVGGAIMFFILTPFFTYKLCQQDAQLYARILTNNVETIYSIFYVSNIVIKLIKRINNNEDDRPREVAKSQHMFEVLGLVSEELAKKFSVSSQAFYDQFLRFNPRIFSHRAIKAGLNERHRKKGEHYQDTFYDKNLNYETKQIVSWIEETREHAKKLKKTRIEMSTLEGLFKAESTSSSIQQLAFILQNTRLKEDDLRLLFKILSAYRGRCLFRRLLAVTILTALEQEDAGKFDEAAEHQLRGRIAVLRKAAGESGADDFHFSAAATNKAERAFLTLWWESASKYMRDNRALIRKEFQTHVEQQISNGRLVNGKTLYIVADKFSRAVRSSISNLKSDYRVVIFVLSNYHPPYNQSARLLSHVLQKEKWVDQIERGKANKTQPAKHRKPQIIAGSEELLFSRLKEGDSLYFITGSSVILSADEVLTTSSQALLTEFRNANEECNDLWKFNTIAMSGRYKRDWPYFFNSLEKDKRDSRIYRIITDMGINKKTLRPSQNHLSHGLYLLKVDTLFGDEYVSSIDIDNH